MYYYNYYYYYYYCYYYYYYYHDYHDYHYFCHGNLHTFKDSACGAVPTNWIKSRSLPGLPLIYSCYFCLFEGFVTDGEFNSLCTMGSECPISILQPISDARQKTKSTPVTNIAKYLRLNPQGISHNILYSFAVCVLCDGAYM